MGAGCCEQWFTVPLGFAKGTPSHAGSCCEFHFPSSCSPSGQQHCGAEACSTALTLGYCLPAPVLCPRQGRCICPWGRQKRSGADARKGVGSRPCPVAPCRGQRSVWASPGMGRSHNLAVHTPCESLQKGKVRGPVPVTAGSRK